MMGETKFILERNPQGVIKIVDMSGELSKTFHVYLRFFSPNGDGRELIDKLCRMNNGDRVVLSILDK